MTVWAALFKNHRAVRRASSKSGAADASNALSECLETIYKELDIAEPVWVRKHAEELSKFQRTKFIKSDFLEPIQFDYLEIEFQHE